MATSFRILNDYLYQGGKEFIIPNYQRGYKWAVKESKEKSSHVEKLCDDFIKARKIYQEDNKKEYFLQGITVSETDNKIILIDGQQRTTTLYLLLWCLDKNSIMDINLIYDIREQSKNYINSLKNTDKLPNNVDDEKYQDIYYFKEAVKQIKRKLSSVEDKNSFKEFMLKNVRILYINIEEDKATKTFTMMNGNKATMLSEELIKAEMLRKVSLPVIETKEVSTSVDENLAKLKEIIARDWETNALRSRYAREWDKWLYWWNRKEIQDFFNVNNPMGLLLEYCFIKQRLKDDYTQNGLKDIQKSYSFDSFKLLLSDVKSTKEQFKKLRDLQKSFEDIFNKPKLHNYLKLSLLCAQENYDKFEVINYFIGKKNEIDLKDDYAKWRLVGATHLEITNLDKNSSEEKESKAEKVLECLSEKFVYNVSNDLALKQLLRLNVEEDNKLKRVFDFEIYNKKSLEHIYPQSKVYHKKEINNEDGSVKIMYKNGKDDNLEVEPQGKEWLNRGDMNENCSEHCIGNLVLLDKNDNSKFNNANFDEKKNYYFDTTTKLYSRNLLHTIAVFANSKWGKEEIEQNQTSFIDRFKQDYNISLNETSDENK
jgi:hypothetical protein